MFDKTSTKVIQTLWQNFLQELRSLDFFNQ